ncbi:probable gluconokinase isoform X1 [Sarcophilus harrisii]|uniref:Gluconokinase n=1 Tax=Sarcophilus harrisii TaxID=9305 RepID=A0A7N4PU73_SARHA|nr:probable gluconokinase isoform X1 [Sarcophilus harrisii]
MASRRRDFSPAKASGAERVPQGWEESPENYWANHGASPGGAGDGSERLGKLGWKFYDADDYHPEENRKKMGKGIPLNDQDRIPWLCNLHDILLRNISSGQSVVLACSALKKIYRNILIRGEGATTQGYDEPGEKGFPELKPLVVYLNGSFEVISGRLAKRKGHFMPPELLQSQFDTLEPPSAPENFLSLNVDRSVSEIIYFIVDNIKIK